MFSHPIRARNRRLQKFFIRSEPVTDGSVPVRRWWTAVQVTEYDSAVDDFLALISYASPRQQHIPHRSASCAKLQHSDSDA